MLFLSIMVFFFFHDCEAKSDNSQVRPNIVFILVDDLGWRDLACYGSKFYETPAIDQLASEGIKFTQAYSAHSLCVPSRYAIMTGKYPARVLGKERFMATEEVCFSEILKESGYKTFFAGKWHLGRADNEDFPLPEEQGFEVNIGGSHIGQPGSFFYPYKGKGRYQRDGSVFDYGVPGLEDGVEGEYLTDRLTRETIRFIKNHSDVPFFIMLSHYAVHTPIEAKPELDVKYNNKLMKSDTLLPTSYANEGTGVTSLRQNHTTYAAMIESVDQSVRDIRVALEELSLAENTIIVFTSDNGGLSNTGYAQRELATSNLPLRAGKGWFYEGGIRVPLVVYWPNVTKPGESEAIVNGMDYFPTFLEMAGIPLRPDLYQDGISFVPVLEGKKKLTRRLTFWHSQSGNPWYVGDSGCSIIREDQYKLIHWYQEGRLELFNLRTDLEEKFDLASKMSLKTRDLLAKLNSWREEVKAYMTDAQPVPNSLFKDSLIVSKWDNATATKSWPELCKKVEIKSTLDQEIQPAYFFSSNQKKRPLIVSLHTWSGNYEQKDDLVFQCIDLDYNYIHPDFRGPNQNFKACGSAYVLQDIDDAISFAIEHGNVDSHNIHILGASGGGFATLLAYMNSKHPIKTFSAWVPISDLQNWYYQSEGRGNKYAYDIARSTVKNPDFDAKNYYLDRQEAIRRSPLYMQVPVKRRLKSKLYLFTGIHDGYTGSVPISQSLNFYNKVVSDFNPNAGSAMIPVADINEMLAARNFASNSRKMIGDRKIHYYRGYKDLVEITVFEGGHECLTEVALDHIRTPN